MVTNVSQIADHQADHQYNAAELQRVFDAQKAAFRVNPMPTAEERIDHLARLKPALLKHMSTLEQAISDDFSHRCSSETKLGEMMPSLEGIKYHIKHVKKWMRDDKRHVAATLRPAKAKVVYQPLGVVGIIVPWNYPIFLALGPLLPALAAGNRVMIKMSEFTPRTAEAFKIMISEIFPENHVCVVTGEAEVAIAFTKLPFDHILFTGSTSVGKHVMRAAAENLTPVTLELGGKSPAIINESFPLSEAAERLGFGKALNAGQTCVAPDYVLCPEQKVNDFVNEMKKVIGKWYPTMLNNDDYTAIVSDRQHQRLQGYLTDAENKGATIIPINPANEDFSHTRKMPLTLVLNTNKDMLIEQDEIFGPIMIIKPYDSLDDAINYVNDQPRPLALYYFDFDQSRADDVLRRTHSGGACINDTVSHVIVDDIPFGGIGPAGMGSYHGKEGFLTFSQAKGVYVKGKINATKFLFPPWNRKIHNFLFNTLLK
ncbi:MAG: coniferyl-aldehyde dehydrogenase [Moraxellaceae bacterium]|nr:MAG: coniferyl-aldehyde dehydrogenase [Moraxellaceae bacterium]